MVVATIKGKAKKKVPRTLLARRKAAASGGGGGRTKMTPREVDFEACAETRDSAFAGVALKDKKMSAAEIGALRDFVKNEDIDLLSYDGLKRVSEAICRWPRPSEIACVLKDAKMKYAMAAASFSLSSGSLGKVIGAKGANLVDFTREHGLLYAWVQALESGPRILLFYTTDDGSIDGKDAEKAIKARGNDLLYRFFKSFGKDYGIRKTDDSRQTVTIRSFSSTLRANAKEFVPAASSS
jgi:hypothetical protein